MKKAGSSKSKSKTRRTSASSGKTRAGDADLGAFAHALAVGHHPAAALSAKDEAVFRAFQANLLSLVSHELRTPLTGVLNALMLLESGETTGDFSVQELISMARRNAQRLHATLASLLDLASLESGTFHARLREVDLTRLARARAAAHASLLKDRRITLIEESSGAQSAESHPLLADPQKLGRAIDLCFLVAIPRAVEAGKIRISVGRSAVALTFGLMSELEKTWDTSWSQALAGYHGGVASPASAFAGVLQSEQAFLARIEEGLGSELLLVHEIMRLHRGQFEARRKDSQVTLRLKLPELSSEEGLRAVLASRAFETSTELSSVALGLVKVPEGVGCEEFRARLKMSLFRASDAVYALPSRGQVALVMDDCRAEDAPRLLARLEKTVGGSLRFGLATCPGEASDPEALLTLAERRLKETSAF